MTMKSRLEWGALLMSCLVPCTAQTQTDTYYNPFLPSGGLVAVSPPTSNVFDAEVGELRISRITAVGGELHGEVVYNVVFDLNGDGHFELKSFEQITVTPEQECTEAEVRQAIPLLSLDLTVEQANELIGCRGNYAAGGATLEEGRTVIVGWEGADGVPNPAAGSPSDYWLPSTGIYRPLTAVSGLTYAGGTRPRIRLYFLDGVLQSYSFFDGVETQDCEAIDLRPGVDLLTLGMTLNSAVAALGCEGSLVDNRVSEAGITRDFTWASGSSSPYLVGSYNPFFIYSDSESVQATFLNDQLETYRYSGTERNGQGVSCTPVELEQAFPLLQEGDAEATALARIPCAPALVRTAIDEMSMTVRYTWETLVRPATVFESPNRSISLTVEEGIVTRFSLGRL